MKLMDQIIRRKEKLLNHVSRTEGIKITKTSPWLSTCRKTTTWTTIKETTGLIQSRLKQVRKRKSRFIDAFVVSPECL